MCMYVIIMAHTQEKEQSSHNAKVNKYLSLFVIWSSFVWGQLKRVSIPEQNVRHLSIHQQYILQLLTWIINVNKITVYFAFLLH